MSRREQVAAAGRQVTLLLARLKEAERLRAELCGEDARVIKIQDADEIAAEAAVEDAPFSSAEPPVASIGALPASDRFVFYQEQPYERDAQTYRTQDRGIEPPFVLPSNLTIKKKDLIPSFGALAEEAQNEVAYLWFGVSRLDDVLVDMDARPFSLEHRRTIDQVHAHFTERLEGCLDRALARDPDTLHPWQEGEAKSKGAERRQDREGRQYISAEMRADQEELRAATRKARIAARAKEEAKSWAGNTTRPPGGQQGGAGRGRGRGAGGSSTPA